MKRPNAVFDIWVMSESTQFSIVAKSAGNAVAMVRKACHARAIKRYEVAARKEKRPDVLVVKRKEIIGAVDACFARDGEGGWKGVSVECRGQKMATLPAGGSAVVTKGSGNSKWRRRMEAAGVEPERNPKPRRERPQPDGKVYRHVKASRPEGRSGLSSLLNKPGLRKRPKSRAKVAAAVLTARQNREWANGQHGNAIRNIQRAEARAKQIKARAMKAVAA